MPLLEGMGRRKRNIRQQQLSLVVWPFPFLSALARQLEEAAAAPTPDRRITALIATAARQALVGSVEWEEEEEEEEEGAHFRGWSRPSASSALIF